MLLEYVVLAIPSRSVFATLRAVNLRWNRHLYELLQIHEIRRILGCNNWDGTMACRNVDLTCPAGMSLAHASWVPGTDRLLCVCLPERDQPSGGSAYGEFRVFGCDGRVLDVIVIDDIAAKRCLVDVCCMDNLKFACAVGGSKELVVIHGDLDRLSTQSARIDLDLGGVDIEIGGRRSKPRLSPDGLFVANSVELVDNSLAKLMQQGGVETEDNWDGAEPLGSFVVMVEVQTRRTLWREPFGGQATIIGFISAGVLITGEQSGNHCLFLVDIATGTRLHAFQTANDMLLRPHYCISPDRSSVVDGHFILKFVPDAVHPTSLVQQLRLELAVEDIDDAIFQWSPDGSRLFCLRGKDDSRAKLDVFDAKTGSLLWRRNAGLGLGSYCEPELGISSDGCCLAVIKHGVPTDARSTGFAIRLLVPIIILFHKLDIDEGRLIPSIRGCPIKPLSLGQSSTSQ